jgi:hypothetical protein
MKNEISKKNEDYIDKERYYELKHFCLQYPMWKKTVASLDSLIRQSDILHDKFRHGDPVEKCAETRELYLKRIELVDRSAKLTDGTMSVYLIKGVTEGLTYDILRVRTNIPCCRETYYKLYRRFFKILSDLRE